MIFFVLFFGILAIGIELFVWVVLPHIVEKKRQEEHKKELEEIEKRRDEWAYIKLLLYKKELEDEVERERR